MKKCLTLPNTGVEYLPLRLGMVNNELCVYSLQNYYQLDDLSLKGRVGAIYQNSHHIVDQNVFGIHICAKGICHGFY